jgi:aryl-alcohol dehydrogenase-like predicted oxidoreductase
MATLSKLTLGTVQLGLPYGIANTVGQPDLSKSHEILRTALDAGINSLDTAYDYGSAEKVIGHFFKENRQYDFPSIVSKFRIEPALVGNFERIRDDVYEKAKATISFLGIEQIPIYMFHQSKDQPLELLGDTVTKLLSGLKKDGLIKTGGMSVDRPGNMDLIIDNDVIEYLQVPINIFDQILIRNNGLIRMKQKNKTVFARSIFLQGLFFVHPDSLTGNLGIAANYLDALKELAEEAGMTVAELAFSFIRDLEGIDSMVFGADNPVQVSQNLELLSLNALSSDVRATAASLFEGMPELIVTPRLWER